jgi:hypothetical protein
MRIRIFEIETRKEGLPGETGEEGGEKRESIWVVR